MRTGEQLLADFSTFIDDSWVSTTTDDGAADGSTVADEGLRRFGRETRLDGFLRVGTNVRRVNGFTGAVASVSPPFPSQVASGTAYSFHNYDPAKKMLALDRARLLAYPQLSVVHVDETLMGDGKSREIVVPSSLRKGPIEVWQESPIGTQHAWNLLTNPDVSSVAGWTSSGGITPTQYQRTRADDVIPRHNPVNVRLVVGAGLQTFTQPASAMQGVTASAAAGRRVSFGVFVYMSHSAGPGLNAVRAFIEDDNVRSYSEYHTNTGWNFLTLSKDITPVNATTLTVGLETLTNCVLFVEGAWFLFGDSVPRCFDTLLVKKAVWHDDATHKVFLAAPPDRGHMLRLIGRAPLTALNGSFSASMEVDTVAQELLFAKAARSLFTLVGLSSGTVEQNFPKIQEVEARFAEMREDWKHSAPASGYLNVWQ